MQGYRKFTAACLALLCLSVLCYLEKIDGAQFLQGLQATVGAFMLANWASAKKTETPK